MLISFIGAPCSGKTTVAALVFADLKEAGVNVEFIPEQARVYIAEKRLREKCFPPMSPSLNDEDQIEIMRRQILGENLLLEACPGSVIVTDSCPLNALLYMSENCRKTNPFITTAVLRTLLYLDLQQFFYVPPIPNANPSDPGRVHDVETSKVLDSDIVDIVLPHIPCPVTALSGTAHHRAFQALAKIWPRLGGETG